MLFSQKNSKQIDNSLYVNTKRMMVMFACKDCQIIITMAKCININVCLTKATKDATRRITTMLNAVSYITTEKNCSLKM